ncbi:MAG: four helix bundle protein [Candidatus Azobacteroides sp.]|nr:four helix bundle protein [Candidatus Azobacteroides sp.]
MNKYDLKDRLQDFAIRIIKMAEKLPDTASGLIVKKQIIRSGTSPGANYRAACISKSGKDFINKLKIVEEELDETIYWQEIIIKTNMLKSDLLQSLMQENKELLSIIISSIKTSKNSLLSSKYNNDEISDKL